MSSAGVAARAAVALGRTVKNVHVRGLPRIMYATAPFVFGRGPRFVRGVSGFWVSLDPREYVSCMMAYGRYASAIVGVMARVLRPGDRVIDVGAQLGYLTAHAAVRVGPTGRVFSLEPDPNAVARLRGVVERNEFSWVRVLPVAASDHEGEIVFHVSETLGWSTAVAGTHLTDLSRTVVAATRIDELVRQGTVVGPIRFVKLDVEGYEPVALAGMQELLARDRPVVVTEISRELLAASGHSPADVLSLVARHDYTLYRMVEERGRVLGATSGFELIAPDASVVSGDVLCVPSEEPLPCGLPVISR